MLTYPKINPPEGVVFREQFINDTFVTDNGGTLVGAPTVSNGVTLNGTNQNVTYSQTVKSVKSVSIVLKATTTSEDIIDFDGGTHTIEVSGGTITATGFAAPTIYVNGVVSSTLTTDKSVITVTTATAFDATALDIGHETTYFDGTIYEVDLRDRVLTASEVEDKFLQQTFKEPTPENSEIWLSLRSHYFDSGVSKEVTTNLGNINSDQVRWGDGSTTTTYPALLDNGGIYCTGGANPDFIQGPSTLSTVEGESYTFSALVRVIGTAGNDYLFSFKNASSQGFAGFLNGDTFTLFADSGGAGNLVSSTGFGEGAGLYHIACVVRFNGSGSSTTNYDYLLYKNGELVASTLNQDTFTASTGDVRFKIGVNESSSNGWAGNIFSPVFTRQALTPTQIKWLKEYSYRNLNI